MVQRVAVARLVHGSGNKRVVVEAGERFDTSTLELSEDDVKRMDEAGTIREPRDDTGRATTAAGPGGEPVTEGRSGSVTGARSEEAVEDDNRRGPGRPPRRGTTDEL